MDDDAVTEALVRSGADFAFELPKGLRTPLGRFFEGSAELSRGQWHKLANARCFIRNAPVFIMDEPSASLDPKSEYELYRNFAEYCEGRTSILISHRLSNVNTCGRIFCLDSGEYIMFQRSIVMNKFKSISKNDVQGLNTIDWSCGGGDCFGACGDDCALSCDITCEGGCGNICSEICFVNCDNDCGTSYFYDCAASCNSSSEL
jgi:hypothetical protein